MVQILKGDRFSVIVFDPGFTNRRAFQVFSKIFDRGSKVVGLFIELDDPSFIIKLGCP